MGSSNGTKSGTSFADLSQGSSPGRLKARKAVPADSPLHDRMMAAVGDRTFRHVAELTSQHPETVRRYLSGQAPSAEFLSNLCAALRINGDWLLTGRGPMKSEDVRTHALAQANTPELFSAMANTLESLLKRVERLEVFVQAMEVKLRARARIIGDLGATANGSTNGHSSIDDRSQAHLNGNGSSPVRARPDLNTRAADVAGAVAGASAKRSSPPAD